MNMVVTMETFLLTKNLLTLLCCLPIHATCALLCARDAAFFDLALLWSRTRLPAVFGNLTFWRASSYSPWSLTCRRAAAFAVGSCRRRHASCRHVAPCRHADA